MRIDHLIAPQGALDHSVEGHLESCEYTTSMFGSDHKALVAIFNNKATPPEMVAPTEQGKKAPRAMPTSAAQSVATLEPRAELQNDNMDLAVNLMQRLPHPESDEYIEEEPELVAVRHYKPAAKPLVLFSDRDRAEVIRSISIKKTIGSRVCTKT
jgi:hypothetical protein